MSSEPGTTIPSPTRRRLRFELIFASVWIAFGLLVLPALIYWIGVAMLGPYGENAGLGAFYLDYFRDLAEPTGRAWALMLGPVLVISSLRLIFWRRRTEIAEPTPTQLQSHPQPDPASKGRRIEPQLGAD